MKRKLTIALTLSSKSGIVFLDEPTSSIDPIARAQIWDMITKYYNETKTTFVVCTHTPKEADAIGQYFIVMNQGKIISSGLRSGIMKSLSLKQKVILFLKKSNPFENLILTYLY